MSFLITEADQMRQPKKLIQPSSKESSFLDSRDVLEYYRAYE